MEFHMTANVIPFLRAETLDARAELVRHGRAVLRSEQPHRVSDIRQACAYLQTYGDATDYQEAAMMLRALNMPVDRPVERPMDWTPVIAGGLTAAVVIWVFLIVALGA
jgi:hypothetical protein